MKKILIIMLILVVSVMFSACGDSSEPDTTGNEEVENDDTSEEPEEEIEVKVVEGERYTDKATGVISITVPSGYIASEDPYYSTEETVSTIMVIPQETASEVFISYLIVQVGLVDDADAYANANTSINAFAMEGEQVDRIRLNGLRGFRVSVDDPASQWASEHYVLVGPKAKGGNSWYSVYIGGIGLDNSYIDDIHDMISTLEFDFDKLL